MGYQIVFRRKLCYTVSNLFESEVLLFMESRLKDMTTGHPLKLMTQFALPLMIGNLFQQLYTVVDTAVVGRALGVAALAALGSSDWLNWMFLGMVQGVTQGFSIPMAHSFGAHQTEELKKVIRQSLLLSALCALLFLTAGQLISVPLLTMLKTHADILPNTVLYLRIIFAGLPVVMAYNLLSAILRSMGDSKTPLYAMIVAAVVNIALDLLFVLVFRWGIAGAAVATVIAQVVSSVICLLQLKKLGVLTFRAGEFRPNFPMIKELTRLGTPMAFQNLIIAVGGMIVQSVVNKAGVTFIAGFTATSKMYGLLEIAAISYGYSMVTYVGQNLGAKKLDRIRQGVRSANGLGFFIAVLVAGTMIVFGRHIVGLFIASPDPLEAAEATQIAYNFLFIMSAFLPILYYLYVTRAAIQGAGNAVLPMLSGVVEFIMRTAVILILPRLIGNDGIYFAEVAAWTGADVVLCISYYYIMAKITRQIKTEE